MHFEITKDEGRRTKDESSLVNRLSSIADIYSKNVNHVS